ncbi:hypothetical protein LPJ60_005615 [Coemansia sp. RSA 2675]|nr:hypothetical protein LPJ60_005615 [Coemansia sp. RSA 2675]
MTLNIGTIEELTVAFEDVSLMDVSEVMLGEQLAESITDTDPPNDLPHLDAMTNIAQTVASVMGSMLESIVDKVISIKTQPPCYVDLPKAVEHFRLLNNMMGLDTSGPSPREWMAAAERLAREIMPLATDTELVPIPGLNIISQNLHDMGRGGGAATGCNTVMDTSIDSKN